MNLSIYRSLTVVDPVAGKADCSSTMKPRRYWGEGERGALLWRRAGLGQDMVMYKNNTAAAMALRAACGRINRLITHTMKLQQGRTCWFVSPIHVVVAPDQVPKERRPTMNRNGERGAKGGQYEEGVASGIDYGSEEQEGKREGRPCQNRYSPPLPRSFSTPRENEMHSP